MPLGLMPWRTLSDSDSPPREERIINIRNVAQAFAPDYGLNINRVAIPVNPYDVFRCDVPNLSTSLYFVVNDTFYDKDLPKAHLPEGVYAGGLKLLRSNIRRSLPSITERRRE